MCVVPLRPILWGVWSRKRRNQVNDGCRCKQSPPKHDEGSVAAAVHIFICLPLGHHITDITRIHPQHGGISPRRRRGEYNMSLRACHTANQAEAPPHITPRVQVRRFFSVPVAFIFIRTPIESVGCSRWYNLVSCATITNISSPVLHCRFSCGCCSASQPLLCGAPCSTAVGDFSKQVFPSLSASLLLFVLLMQVYVRRGNLLYLTPRREANVSLAAREKEVGEKLAKMQTIAAAQPAAAQTQSLV